MDDSLQLVAVQGVNAHVKLTPFRSLKIDPL